MAAERVQQEDAKCVLLIESDTMAMSPNDEGVVKDLGAGTEIDVEEGPSVKVVQQGAVEPLTRLEMGVA